MKCFQVVTIFVVAVLFVVAVSAKTKPKSYDNVSLNDPELKKAVAGASGALLYRLNLLNNNDIKLVSAKKPHGLPANQVQFAIVFNVYNRKHANFVRRNCRAELIKGVGTNKVNKGDTIYTIVGNRVKCD